MRKLILVGLLITGGCFSSGCIDFKRAGSDAAAGALNALEARVDEKIQSIAGGLETKVDDVKVKTEAELERRGWNPETIAAIIAGMNLLGAAGTNYLRNKKYIDLPLWKKIFTGGGASKTATSPIAAEPTKPQA